MNFREEKKDSIKIDVKQFENYECKKKIAVQLHLFYVDLTEEFVKYLSNIPFNFDLLVSIVDKSQKDFVIESFSKIDKLDNVIVEIVQNRGRDVAPFVSVFGKKILEYDYICHIHSKKSLFTGSEQTQWRVHLLEGLFGSEEIIKSHIYQLDKGEKIGLIYPETFCYMPYQGHTWLQNKFSRDELLDRIGVKARSSQIYFDYPMGTMFLASVDALKQFFQADIKVEEFPKEGGQKDGTIAHAFERCLGLVCKYNDYNLLVFDNKDMTYSYEGRKNLQQYTIKSYDGMKKELQESEIISFDIFDTLLSRRISNPEAIIGLLELKIDRKFGVKSDFKRLRIEAEGDFRQKNSDKDCDLKQIYAELNKSKLDKELLEYAFHTERQLEKLLLEPKTEVVKLYNGIKAESGKKVNIVSDMQLSIEDIEDILKTNEIELPDKLYLSSSMNLRKDRGDMWEKYFADADGKLCTHVGDDEVSDVQIPGDYKIGNYHLLGNKALFQLTNFGRIVGGIDDRNASDAVELGLIYNKMFSNPLAYNESNFEVKISDGNTLGYGVFGPVILNYVLWLMKEAAILSADKLMFFSREGYILKQIYDKIAGIYGGEVAKSQYLYVSRRALSYASLETDKDLEESLDKFYEGSLSNLLFERFGIQAEELKDEDIKLPDNKNRVLKALMPYKEQIFKNASKEKEEYINYYRDVDLDGKNIIVSDIGYSGTIQYYLSKLTGKTYHGRYFATDEKKLAERISGSSMVGYYIDNDGEQEISMSNIHRYHLILEGILIAPDGQFVKISDKKPVFAEDKNELFNDTIKNIHEGMLQYAEDYANIMQEVLLDELPEKILAERLIEAVVKEDIVDGSIANDLIMDDKYCGGGLRNPIDYYKR